MEQSVEYCSTIQLVSTRPHNSHQEAWNLPPTVSELYSDSGMATKRSKWFGQSHERDSPVWYLRLTQGDIKEQKYYASMSPMPDLDDIEEGNLI